MVVTRIFANTAELDAKFLRTFDLDELTSMSSPALHTATLYTTYNRNYTISSLFEVKDQIRLSLKLNIAHKDCII